MAREIRRWWWLPLVILVGLFVKAWLVGGWVAGVARERAADAAGVPVERVEMVDGLNVHLTGFSSSEDLEVAVSAVDALDSSWEVTGELAGDEDAAADDADDDAGATEAEADDSSDDAVAAAEPSVEVAIADDEVVLSGTVATEAIQSDLVTAAETILGPDAVVDELTVDGDVADEGGELTVAGEAAGDTERETWLEGAEAMASAAGLDLVDDTTVAAIEESLNELFELEPIQFATLSARLRSESTSTLDEAAELLNATPDGARLRVVGHTDSDGDADRNQALSERRAEAVVAYLVDAGVDPERLEAEGRGESELEVSPDLTAQDKQRNRRIEWELVE